MFTNNYANRERLTNPVPSLFKQEGEETIESYYKRVE